MTVSIIDNWTLRLILDGTLLYDKIIYVNRRRFIRSMFSQSLIV